MKLLSYLQDLHQEILAHESAYQDIRTKSHELSEKSAGQDKEDLDDKMSDVTRRWEGIIGNVAKRLAVLEEVVVCSVQYADASRQVKGLFEVMEGKVEVIKHISSDPEVLKKQRNTAKVCFTERSLLSTLGIFGSIDLSLICLL